jgi:hypothetical protein
MPGVIYSETPITIADALTEFPVLGTTTAYKSCSQTYGQIPTIRVVEELVAEGFNIHGVTVAGCRSEGRENFQKHMIRLRRPGFEGQAEVPEICLLNAHDLTSQYKLFTGAFRFACANGLLSGEHWGTVTIRHSGREILPRVIEGTYQVVSQFDRLVSAIDKLKAIALNPDEQTQFVKQAVELRFGKDLSKLAVSPDAFNLARRPEDEGNDLWHTYNRVQEGIIRGGLHGVVREENGQTRRRTLRGINAIGTSVKLNRQLFGLVEQVAEAKGVLLAA